MRRFRKVSLASLVASVASMSALANGPDYTYAEVGYFNLEFDEVDVLDLDGDGYFIGGSAALTEMVHVVGGYADGEIDVENTSLSADYTSASLGLGVNYRVATNIDIVGRVSYVSAEVDVGGGLDVDEDGYGIGIGLRGMASPQLEFNGGLSYTDLGGDFDAETALHVGGVYSFTDAFAVSGGLVVSDDATEFRLGGRWYIAR